MDKRHKRWHCSKSDVLVAVCTVAIVFCSIFAVSYLNYKNTWNDMMQRYQNESETIYAYLEERINEEMFDEINDPADMEKAVYLELQDRLDAIRQVMQIRYLYTAKMNEKGQYIYVVDGLPMETEDFAPPGTLIEEEIIDNMAQALTGEPVLPDRILDTQWGKIANAYFPIHTYKNTGATIGVIGIEFDMEPQAAILERMRTIPLIVAIIASLVAMLLTVPLYRRITNIYREASRAKSDFLSSMSHELRTPLNAISGMAYLGISASDDQQKVKECLTKIQSSASYMTMLINDVLDMAKIESGKMTLHEDVFDLPKTISELVELTENGAKEKQQLYQVSCHLPTRWVRGDKMRLQQVLINIISNAVKYTPKQGRIDITIKELSNKNGYVEVFFAVEDTGIGIAPEAIKYIFNAFERDDWAKKHQIEGTGLGLSIAADLIKKMGSKIEVESVPGQGSRFYFTIRLQTAEPLPTIIDEQQPRSSSTGDLRILLVEDNELNRQIAHSLLAMEGYLVDEAVDGSQAVEMFANHHSGYYQAILMDLRMPVMDGYEATRQIRHLNDDGAKIPIIAITANAFDEDVQKAKDVGMTSYIPKPIDVRQLSLVLAQWVKK